ncbi:MAG: glycosyltransferase family 1 protein [Bacilli bacterium]|nr:glycosyltransferase family 1 protein [Bacilli bacterium]
MKKKPVKIVQILGFMDSGGIESSVMNYFRNLDKERFIVDFIVCEGSTLPQKREIESKGSKIYIVPHYKYIFKYIKEVRKILKTNKYDIVHAQMNSLSIFPLYCAYKENIGIRICHSHSTANSKEWKKNIIKNILKPFSKVYATDYFACSEHAGKWLYGKNIVKNKKFYIVNNAVDMNKFLFNNKKRKEIRRKLNINDDYVIGHIGRFMPQKNHKFLIEVLYEIKKELNDVKLLLIGDGKLEKEIRRKVVNLKLEDNVIFLGVTDHVNDYLQAMDIFAFPSLYEGLGMVAVEAQINNLYVLASTEVPVEAQISNKIDFLNLNKYLWKQRIIDLKESRKNEFIELSNYKSFDIYNQTRKLEKKYEEIINYGNIKK